jgi:hypothetical protein
MVSRPQRSGEGAAGVELAASLFRRVNSGETPPRPMHSQRAGDTEMNGSHDHGFRTG